MLSSLIADEPLKMSVEQRRAASEKTVVSLRGAQSAEAAEGAAHSTHPSLYALLYVLVRRAEAFRVHEEHRDGLPRRRLSFYGLAAQPNALGFRLDRVADSKAPCISNELVHQERLARAVSASDNDHSYEGRKREGNPTSRAATARGAHAAPILLSNVDR